MPGRLRRLADRGDGRAEAVARAANCEVALRPFPWLVVDDAIPGFPLNAAPDNRQWMVAVTDIPTHGPYRPAIEFRPRKGFRYRMGPLIGVGPDEKPARAYRLRLTGTTVLHDGLHIHHSEGNFLSQHGLQLQPASQFSEAGFVVEAAGPWDGRVKTVQACYNLEPLPNRTGSNC